MTTSRLIGAVVIQAGVNDVLRIDDNGTGRDVTLTPAGTYYHSADDSATDFCKLVADAISAATTGANVTSISIFGVDTSDPDTAEGRLYWNTIGVGYIDLLLSHANTTVDPGWFGEAAATVRVTTGGVGNYVHKLGWYPQLNTDSPTDYGPTVTVPEGSVRISSGGYPDIVRRNTRLWARLSWDRIPPALMLTQAAAYAATAGAVNLTTGDPYASWEAFCLAVTATAAENWRYYADATSATYLGPFIFPPGSPYWTNPIPDGLVQIVQRAGGIRSIQVDGMEDQR